MPVGPFCNIASADEHVKEPERRIRVAKERFRAYKHSLPFRRLPVLMVIIPMLTIGRMLNYFPTAGGVSSDVSPRMLLTGEQLDYRKDLGLQLGAYCQVHQNEKPRNSMKARTLPALYLGPSGNLQGGRLFLSLSTGQSITRFAYDVLPMPATVIARVEALAKGQPEDHVFADRKGRIIGDVEIPGVDGGQQAPLNDSDMDDLNEPHAADEELASAEDFEENEAKVIPDVTEDQVEQANQQDIGDDSAC